MAKRDKNRSYSGWEDEWDDYKSESADKKNKQVERRKRRQQIIVESEWIEKESFDEESN